MSEPDEPRGDTPTPDADAPERASAAGPDAEPPAEKDAAPASPDVDAPTRDAAPEGPGADAPAEEEEPLLPTGNRLQLVRGPAAIVLGSLIAFVIMAIDGQYRWGVPVGALGILLATFGVLDLLGSFDDADAKVATRTTARALLPHGALAAGGALGVAVLASIAVAGRLPVAASALLVPAAFLTAVVGVYRLGDALGAWSVEPDGTRLPLLRRHGFWLVVLTTLLYLPMLGSHSLSDPWETHYGEVSREILARNDWISLWWAQDGWFWSKPVFDFWIQALAMATLGVRFRPGEMLAAAAEGRTPWPEWAVRLPIFLLTLVAGYLLYKAVAAVFGRRAGLLGGIVLATMPQWFLVSHQTMTDMPFVATMSATMALFLLGAHADGEREVQVYEVAFGRLRLRFSAYHLVMGAIVACALPQVLYLLSRNLDVRLAPFGVHVHMDSFMSGSAQNCGLPGNEGCRQQLPVARGLTPALQALIWMQTLGVLAYLNWGERRVQRLYFLAAWLFAALSTMAKGPAGLGLPVLSALVYIVVTRRYKDLLRVEITSGLLIVLAVALPWFVAMYSRHGQPFTDRLIFHDMFKRAFTHVHDTNEGDDTSFRFYVWQLGYAMFPWTGLAPAGLVWWLRRREDADRRGDASVFLAMWFLFAFALFSLMLTKFHHYIMPAVPPAAMLIGVLLDDMLRSTDVLHVGSVPGGYREPSGGVHWWTPLRAPPLRSTAMYFAGLGGGVAVALAGLARMVPRWNEVLALPPSSAPPTRLRLLLALALQGGAVGWLLVLGGLAIAIAGAMAPSSHAASDPPPRPETISDADVQRSRYERVLLGAIGLAGALLVFVVGRDIAGTREGQPSQIRLLHLFTYNYKRPWPASLDFQGALWAFAAGATVLTLLLIAARWRRHVVAALLALSIAFAAWGLDVYFVKTSPHWGQRELVIAYHREAASIPGPLVAYQMNWKGENFYTGNKVPAFVSSGKKFTDWILEQKKKGVKTFYFLTEHGRTGTLSNELGGPRTFDKLTPPELNNKFLLVRATFE